MSLLERVKNSLAKNDKLNVFVALIPPLHNVTTFRNKISEDVTKLVTGKESWSMLIQHRDQLNKAAIHDFKSNTVCESQLRGDESNFIVICSEVELDGIKKGILRCSAEVEVKAEDRAPYKVTIVSANDQRIVAQPDNKLGYESALELEKLKHTFRPRLIAYARMTGGTLQPYRLSPQEETVKTDK